VWCLPAIFAFFERDQFKTNQGFSILKNQDLTVVFLKVSLLALGIIPTQEKSWNSLLPIHLEQLFNLMRPL
jgi:hypothetical protein